MIEYKGKYTTGKILIDSFESSVVSQLQAVLDNPAFSGSNIALMPDCHVGKGAIVGFTSTLTNVISPSIIGVDIGCGVLAVKLGKIKSLKLDKLDKFIRKNIPIGEDVNDFPEIEYTESDSMISRIGASRERIINSLGSMGGGNHFISIEVDTNNIAYLIIHTGSRQLGFYVESYHAEIAEEYMRKVYCGGSYGGFGYLPLHYRNDEYINDMKTAQKFASLNRSLMAKKITEKFYKLQYDTLSSVESIHNYINFTDNIVRKGAISAHQGEKVIIPVNSSFGSILATGKSCKEYNFSAPHGAGRKMNRHDSKGKVDLDVYRKSMQGVYSTSIGKDTLDESPQVYKNPKLIIENISSLVDVDYFLKPVYNLKAGSTSKNRARQK